MGGAASSPHDHESNIMATASGEPQIFKLAVSSGSCTGVFWRGDPYKGGGPPDNNDWPRNGALLKGIVHSVKGVQHLQVKPAFRFCVAILMLLFDTTQHSHFYDRVVLT